MTFTPPRTLALGDWKIHLVSDGHFWLDGGAMFGVIPKVLWSRVIDADEKNRIPLALNCLLIETGNRVILIDTGIGAKEDEKFRRIYRVDPAGMLAEQLALCGFCANDVDWVINTHLHFDHCGGNTLYAAGQEQAAFPNATYFVQRGEMAAAANPNERSQVSYLPRNWQSIRSLELLDGDCELMPGVSVFLSPGHTAHHQSVRIERRGDVAVFLGDIMPTVNHIGLPWIMGYDLYPLTTLETKKKLLPRMAEENWLLIFQHERSQPIGRLDRADGAYRFRET